MKVITRIIIKKCIDGEFVKVASYYAEDVQQIKHHKSGFEIIVAEGYSLNNIETKFYDNECVIEFNKDKAERYYTTSL